MVVFAGVINISTNIHAIHPIIVNSRKIIEKKGGASMVETEKWVLKVKSFEWKLEEQFRKKGHGLRSVFNDQSIGLDIV